MTILAPVVAHPDLRLTYRRLDRPRQVAVALLAGSTLAGHYAFGTRSFPFVNWDMYASPVHGDPVIFEYHLALRSGTVVPLALSRLLGTASAARLMEALRRQVSGLQARPADAPDMDGRRQEHARAVRAIAGWYGNQHPQDPPVRVLVSERTVSIASGHRSCPRRLWEIEVA